MTSTVGITTAAALDVALLAEAGFTNLLGALRSGGRLAVVSRDEPDGMHAVLAHVGFVHADAQTQRFAPLRFHAIVSRRSHQVFADPEAGFTNLLGALRSGGRLAVVGRDEPDGVHAVLARVGFVDVSRIALEADDAGPVWLVRAGRRD